MLKKYKAKIENNKLKIYDEQFFEMNIMSLDGKEVELTIGKLKSNRSIQQNRYLFGVVYKLISEHTGYTSGEIHDLCKSMFLKRHLDIITIDKSERYTVIGSSATLDKMAFSEYTNQIKDWASMKLGVYIPDPSEFDYNF